MGLTLLNKYLNVIWQSRIEGLLISVVRDVGPWCLPWWLWRLRLAGSSQTSWEAFTPVLWAWLCRPGGVSLQYEAIWIRSSHCRMFWVVKSIAFIGIELSKRIFFFLYKFSNLYLSGDFSFHLKCWTYSYKSPYCLFFFLSEGSMSHCHSDLVAYMSYFH